MIVVLLLQRHYLLQALRLQAAVLVLVAAVPVVLVPAAVDLAVLQVLLDPLAVLVLVAADTAADTRNTKVLSYRSSKELRVHCAR